MFVEAAFRGGFLFVFATCYSACPMDAALSGLLLLLFVVPGFIAGRVFDYFAKRAPEMRTHRIAVAREFLNKSHELVLRVSLYLLLLIMGIRLVEDPKVVANLPILGLQALAFAALGVIFSVALTWPLKIKAVRTPAHDADSKKTTVADANEGVPAIGSTVVRILRLFAAPALLLGIVAVGAIVAALLPDSLTIPVGDLTDICLRIMLLAVGLGLGFTPTPHIAGSFSRSAFFLPLLTAVASLAAGVVASLIFIPHTGQALSLAAGFGWYSLSAVMIADLGHAQLGALAFLCNLFRESIALLSIPLLQRLGKTGSAISAAGATSMDVALPILSLYGASPAIPLAVYHGFVLSLLVPVLVPVFLSL